MAEPVKKLSLGFKLAFGAGVLLLLLPFGCVGLVGYATRDPSIDTVEQITVRAPSGANRAVLLRREQRVFFDMADWVELVVADDTKSTLVGDIAFRGKPDVRWLSDTKLLVTLHDPLWHGYRRQALLPTRALDVEIHYHLGDNLHVATERKYLRDMEARLWVSRVSRKACRGTHEAWSAARAFYAWARGAADNGDPDPGPWVSAVFPADCSTLPQP